MSKNGLHKSLEISPIYKCNFTKIDDIAFKSADLPILFTQEK